MCRHQNVSAPSQGDGPARSPARFRSREDCVRPGLGPAEDEALAVLVVNDDTALVRLLAGVLRTNGYVPLTATSGQVGLELATRNPPALAIVDLQLPDMDGLDLVSGLHALSDLTEVVALAAEPPANTAMAGLRDHCVDYLLKPVRVEILLQMMAVAAQRWQRRNAEFALVDSEQRYHSLFDRNPQPLWVFDSETLRFLAVNQAAIQKYGYSRDEFLAMSIEAIRPPEDVAALRRFVDRADPDTRSAWSHRKKDGSLIDVEVSSNDLDFAGRPARIVLPVDVTERVAAERTLEVRERQQAAVAAFGDRALLAKDLQPLFAEATALIARTLDLPLSGVLERRPDRKLLVLKAGVGWKESALGTSLVVIGDETQSGYTLAHNEPVIVADLEAEGRFLGAKLLHDHEVVSGITVVIPGPNKAYGVLNAHDRRVRNFTQDDIHFMQAIAHILGSAIERERTDAVFRQTQRLEAVGRLAAGIAHDFNNILTAINGYAEIARESVGAAHPVRDDLSEILKAAQRAAGLTRQLLAFSSQQVMQPRIVDLSEVVIDVENMLCRLIGADVELLTSLDKELGRVRADPGQLEQVLVNLCVNARDAMPFGGKLTIETANVSLNQSLTADHPIRSGGQYVMMAVSDTGVGMDHETQTRVFEPFFTTKSAEKGSGLGLATVYGIVKQSGGEIWVYSEVGQGTTFKVFFPRIADQVSEAPARERAVSARGGTETILLAEDDDGVRRVVHRILEKAGYTVLLATNGTEAEAVSEEHPGQIHLLITDMVMPMMNGRELANRILKRRAPTRALYLSGYTDDSVVRQGLLEDGASFLQKPFSEEALLRKIRSVLEPTVDHAPA